MPRYCANVDQWKKPAGISVREFNPQRKPCLEEGEGQSTEVMHRSYGSNAGSALRYRQHGEQTVIVCVLMHYLQPNMSVGIQEVIIIFVPGGMRYNRV